MVLTGAAVSAVPKTLSIINDYTASQGCVWYYDPIQGTLDGPRNVIKFAMLVSAEFGGDLRTPLCRSLASGGMSEFYSESPTSPIAIP